MLLDRIDIDTHGPLQRVELGPFSGQINVVKAPKGSGKTALARFVRDALVERQYPLGMLSSSTGRVVFAGHHGLVHYYREQDGTANGRQTIQYEPRGTDPVNFGVERSGWLPNINNNQNAELALQAFKIPEAIADFVITDSAVTNIAHVVSACVRSGLDIPPDCGLGKIEPSTPNAHAATHGYDSAHQHSAKQLRADLADIEAELANLQSATGPLTESERSSLLSRRSWLSQCLNGHQHADHNSKVAFYDSFATRPASETEANPKPSNLTSKSTEPQQGELPDDEPEQRRHSKLRSRLQELQNRARTLRSKQNQLRHCLSDLSKRPFQTHAGVHTAKATITGRTQKQRRLEEIDAQVIHWQRAQMEVAALQQSLLAGKSDATSTSPPADERSLRRMRLNRFLSTLDQNHSQEEEVAAAKSGSLSPGRETINQHILLATRQIDWLVERYTDADRGNQSWYEQDQSISGTATTLSETLRTIRDVLRQINGYNQRQPKTASHPPMHELAKARRCEQWLLSAIKQLKRHRDEVLRRTHAIGSAADQEWPESQNSQMKTDDRERKERAAELESVTLSLDVCLTEAAEVRRSMQNSGLNVRGTSNTRLAWLNEDGENINQDNADQQSARSNRELLVKELKEVDARLNALARAQWLRARRTQLLSELGPDAQKVTTSSTLAHEASRWLIRLTGGRLQRIEWSTEKVVATPTDQLGVTKGLIEIDGKDATECAKLDKACVVLAVRMAAGEFLARSDQHVPLVIETVGDVEQLLHDRCIDQAESGKPFIQKSLIGAFTAALHDYASDGHQLLILTSSENLTSQLRRVGSRIEQVHPERIVHPHRPLWKSSYAAEKYAGPHPHTYGLRDVPEELTPMKGSKHMPNANANQSFDMAWQNPQRNRANATNHSPEFVSGESPDCVSDGSVHRDGYYYTDTYSTIESPNAQNVSARNPSMARDQSPPNAKEGIRMSHDRNFSTSAPVSPFFLSVDSPIDQAPSIDAVAAARLRGLQVSHVVHLMQQDPCRLADALGLANVEANTIRRWQAECRLVCRVPNLRGFDARILVACGITTPATLAATPPINLLHKVEKFLATERGQQLLLSGSSHELARITGWIATANSQRLSSQTGKTNSQLGHANKTNRKTLDPHEGPSATTKHDTEFAPALDRNRHDEHGHPQKREHAQVNRASETSQTSVVQFEQNAESPSTGTETEIPELRFYLQQDAPVVDAPSIGERMEERLQAIGIYTIQDLLDGDSEQIAELLDHRRVNADTVLQWQQQTTLVCCIPMLRGHDAQLLVAADIVTPEDLAGWDAEELFQIIDPIARSNEGKRILRGGNLPDLEEITDWINFAQHNRKLQAA